MYSSSSSQKKATDPSRFTNRGGNLLKEEKQRTELHKSLPKVRGAGGAPSRLPACIATRPCVFVSFSF